MHAWRMIVGSILKPAAHPAGRTIPIRLPPPERARKIRLIKLLGIDICKHALQHMMRTDASPTFQGELPSLPVAAASSSEVHSIKSVIPAPPSDRALGLRPQAPLEKRLGQPAAMLLKRLVQVRSQGLDQS